MEEMKELMPYILAYYDKEIVKKICNKYGFEPMTALKLFLIKYTYQYQQKTNICEYTDAVWYN